MSFKSFLPAVVTLAVLSGCSPKIPFTQRVREQYNLSGDELKRIQFYISDPLVLQRGTNENAKATEEGTLVIKSGSNVEQVYFKRNTPGAVSSVVDAQKMTVSFEDGAEKYLVFGSENDRSGYYRVQAVNWDKSGKGKINYGGQTYYAAPGSQDAILMFKMKSLRKLRVDQKVVKGKKIN